MVAALLALLVVLSVPASAIAGPRVTKSTQTFSFASFVPCAGEFAEVEGTLRMVLVERPDGGLVARQVWTHFHGTGFRLIDGVRQPTGTKWVYSSATGTVLIDPEGDRLRFRTHHIVRLTSAGSAPNLRTTIIRVDDWNPETQTFETRVNKQTITCA